MEHSTPQVEILFEALKLILKRKKLTYKKLAQRLKMSEAGIKKIFSTKNMSIIRLAHICDEIGISFVDLLALNESFRKREFTFTEEQEIFFTKNPHFYNFFRALFFDELQLDEIKSSYRLSDRSIRHYLKRLEEQGVLEVHPNDKVRFLVYGRLRWIPNGPWMKKYYRVFNEKLCNQVSANNFHGLNFRTVGFATLPKQQVEHLIEELNALEQRYRDLAFDHALVGTSKSDVAISWNFQLTEGKIQVHESHIPNLL